MTEPTFTHLDDKGNAHMVDVGDKAVTRRRAVARGSITMTPATSEAILAGTLPKGDVLATARIAGIMGAKRTADLIPLCHPLALTSVQVTLRCEPASASVEIEATCRLRGKTGVEMEALTAASVAALTVYDMCKAIDRGMVITDVQLLQKHGGKTGSWVAGQ